MPYGIRNGEHFKTAIYFHCGDLDLYPATHGKAHFISPLGWLDHRVHTPRVIRQTEALNHS